MRKPGIALAVMLMLAGAVAGTGPAAASAATCQSWSGLQPPSPGANGNELSGVAVLSPCNAWTVGSLTNGSGQQQTLIEHWFSSGGALQALALHCC